MKDEVMGLLLILLMLTAWVALQAVAINDLRQEQQWQRGRLENTRKAIEIIGVKTKAFADPEWENLP